MSRRIVVIGAAGEMCRVAVERFGLHNSDWLLDLYDLNEVGLQEVAATLPPGRTTTGRLDLFDATQLRGAIQGADLVILGAGPYMRTAEPVLEACIDVGVDYLDYDDDVESTQAAIALHDPAVAAGIGCYVGAGASPGMSNVMAVDVASRLDTLETLDVCWCTGDEGARTYGAAVIEHLLHIAAGPCVTWRNGRYVTVESFVDNDVYAMGGGLGDTRLYEVAHPEAVTLPRRYPEAKRIRVMGGLRPAPLNGLSRGIGVAVRDGKMTTAEAVEFFQEVMQDNNGSLKGWRHGLAGMLGQVRRGESGIGTLGSVLWAGLRKHHDPFQGGLAAVATGLKDGEPTTIIRRTPRSGPDTYLWSSMGAITGTSIAAFTMLALERRGQNKGVLFPEDWVEPAAFYAALARVGTPIEEVIEADDLAVAA